MDDPVVFLGQTQAVAFAKVKTTVHYAENTEEKIQQILGKS